MLNKTRNNTVFHKKTFLLILMIIVLIIPIIFSYSKTYPNVNINKKFLQENVLNLNEFTKENYTEIQTTAKHGLGNITIDDIDFTHLELGIFNENVNHPLIIEDIINQTLKLNVINMQFIETTSPAIMNNLNGNIDNKLTVTIKFNETVHVEYNNSEAKYLIYHSRYVLAELLEFCVNNGSIISNLTEGGDYTIDDFGYLVFYYEDYFQEGPEDNFDMYLIWKYDLAFGNWSIEQSKDEILEITETEQEITPEFHYSFYFIGWRYAFLMGQTIPIDAWRVALTINPLDKEEFNNHKLILNEIEMNVGNHLNPDKSIQIKLSDQFTPERGNFSLYFTSSFRLRFEGPVGKLWAIDRLIGQRNIRERIYFCNLLSGPRHIYLENVEFHEPSIYFEELINSHSLFNRDVLVNDANESISKRLGLNVTIPYMYVGETCPFSIEYFTFQKLKIVITDNIKMPLVGAKIKLFHFGVRFGTYISNTSTQPIIPRKSDENGQIVLYNVPRGIYTVRVYWEGKFVKESSVSTYNEVNYIYTSIIHTPFWILFFGGLNGIILILGVIFYLKYKKLR